MQGATMAARAGRAAMLFCLAAAPCAAASAQGTAPAQPMAMPMPAGAASPSTDAYRQAMTFMDAAMMAAPPTGDADRDLVSGMLGHHQGAIDMVRVELRYGRDPAMRRLAQDIVVVQTREIAHMRDWQKHHAR